MNARKVAIPDRLARGEKLVLSPADLASLHGCNPAIDTMYTFTRQTDSRRGDLGYCYVSGRTCGGAYSSLDGAIRAAAASRR